MPLDSVMVAKVSIENFVERLQNARNVLENTRFYFAQALSPLRVFGYHLLWS